MPQSGFRAIALFFRLTLIDPHQTRLASIRCLRSLRSKGIDLDGDLRAPILGVMIETWEYFHSRALDADDSLAVEEFSGISISLQQWQRFLQEASKEEVLIYLFCEILQTSLSEVALAMKVSEGSLRHRRSRSLYRLADILVLKQESSHVEV